MPLAALMRSPGTADIATPWSRIELDAESFRGLAALVYEGCGIVMPESKRTMLETRLRRRVEVNGLEGFRQYVAFLKTPDGRAREFQAFTDCVVTNQTSFFREPPHFDYLGAEELQRLAAGNRSGALNVWSAAASSGEEAYSIAMIANEASQGGRLFPWSVLATDISIRMLKLVREAVYSNDAAASVPSRLRQKYFGPAAGHAASDVQITPELRRNIRLGQINLMHDRYAPGQMMDIIFCRNVLIYFQTDVQVSIVEKLCRHLRPGGLLILGHSESLRSPKLPLRLIRCNIHERMEE